MTISTLINILNQYPLDTVVGYIPALQTFGHFYPIVRGEIKYDKELNRLVLGEHYD